MNATIVLPSPLNNVPTISTTDTRWNRCKSTCGCHNVNVKDAFCACNNGKCERDRRTNAQMRRYALAVNEMLTGYAMDANGMIKCPLTGHLVHISLCEVDKANESLGYVMGNVCMASKVGNQERGKMQKYYGDLAKVSEYINDVVNASIGIPLPAVSFSFDNRFPYLANTNAKVECDPHMANVINGPYGA